MENDVLKAKLQKIGFWAAIVIVSTFCSYLAFKLGVKLPEIPPPVFTTYENVKYVMPNEGLEDLSPEELEAYYRSLAMVNEPRMFAAAVKVIEDLPSDKAKWHAENDQKAANFFGFRKKMLGNRTALIRDHGVRAAGFAFLSAMRDTGTTDASGMKIYKIDRDAIRAIDPAKLVRWAEIALTVLTFVEPFVPPPYNLAVHAAVMLLKAWLENQNPQPKDLFPETNRELDWTAALPVRREGWYAVRTSCRGDHVFTLPIPVWAKGLAA